MISPYLYLGYWLGKRKIMQWYRLCLLYILIFPISSTLPGIHIIYKSKFFLRFLKVCVLLKFASMIYKKNNLVLSFSCAAPLFIVFIPVWESGKVFHELFNIVIGLLVGIAFLSFLFSTLTGVININFLFFSIGILKSEILDVYLKKKDKVNDLFVILLRL